LLERTDAITSEVLEPVEPRTIVRPEALS